MDLTDISNPQPRNPEPDDKRAGIVVGRNEHGRGAYECDLHKCRTEQVEDAVHWQKYSSSSNTPQTVSAIAMHAIKVTSIIAKSASLMSYLVARR